MLSTPHAPFWRRVLQSEAHACELVALGRFYVLSLVHVKRSLPAGDEIPMTIIALVDVSALLRVCRLDGKPELTYATFSCELQLSSSNRKISNCKDPKYIELYTAEG